MTRTPLLVRAAALAAVSLGLAGGLSACGGGDSDTKASDSPSSSAAATSEAATPISKDDFLTQGNAICREGNDAIAAIGDTVDTSDQDAVLEALKTKVLPNISGQITALKALGYPDGDQETLDGIYSDAETLIASLEQDPTSMTGSDDPFSAVNGELNDYGLTECGSSS